MPETLESINPAYTGTNLCGATFGIAGDGTTGTAVLSQELEQLTFLLRMSQCVEASSNRSIRDLVEFLIPQLPQSIQCDWVAFIGALGLQPTADYAIDEAYSIIEAGKREVDDATIIELVGQNATKALDEPYLGQVEGAAACAVVSEFILARVQIRSRHWGWMIAVRWHRLNRQGSGFRKGWSHGEAAVVQSTAGLLATQAANVELLIQRDDLIVNVVRTLVTAIEAKDAFVRGHSERVAIYARMLAKALGLNTTDCERIYLTGLLHDIGKIGVPDATLQKTGELTAEEFAQVKRHPESGWHILQALQPLRHVLPGVLHHHERMDGQGYPDGLHGDQIPLDARILAVADAYDAMTSDRSYRHGLSQELAEDVLKNGTGIQWDADVVEVFFRIMPEVIKTRQLYQTRTVKPIRRRTGRDCDAAI